MYHIQFYDWDQTIENLYFISLDNAKKKYKELKRKEFTDPKRCKEETYENYLEIIDTFNCARLMFSKIETED